MIPLHSLNHLHFSMIDASLPSYYVDIPSAGCVMYRRWRWRRWWPRKRVVLSRPGGRDLGSPALYVVVPLSSARGTIWENLGSVQWRVCLPGFLYIVSHSVGVRSGFSPFPGLGSRSPALPEIPPITALAEWVRINVVLAPAGCPGDARATAFSQILSVVHTSPTPLIP